MARPSVEGLNRATGFTSDRQTAAPGLAVQAPLNVNVGPNNLQALGEILGVVSNTVTKEAADVNAERIREQNELTEAKAEADSHGDKLDVEQYQKSRIYRKRYDLVKGAREGTEITIGMANAYRQFVKDNPLADENETRTFLDDWQRRALVDDQGNPKAFTQNPRSNAIVESAMNETAYKIIADHRAGYEKRVKEKSGGEVVALFMADARAKGGTTPGNLVAARSQLRSFEYTDEEANTELTNATLATARNLMKPELLDMLPEVWPDGSLGPKSDPAMLDTITTQRAIIAAKAEAKHMEELEPTRLDYIGRMDEKIRSGIPLTEQEKAEGLRLGLSATAVGSMADSAIRTGIRMKEEAEKELEKKRDEEQEWADIQANPFSFSNDKVEKAYGAKYDAAVRANNPAAATALVRQAVEANALPMSLRNELNRIPSNPEAMGQWRNKMKAIDDLDDQVFLSLSDDARNAYAAYNGLKAIGRFTDQQIFQRLQARDPERGSKFVSSDRGNRAINQIVGANAGSLERSKAAEFVRAFTSLSDLNDNEATDLAKASFEKTYLVREGRVFHRSVVPSDSYLNWIKVKHAEDRTKAGRPTDPDDVTVSPIDGTKTLIIGIRGEPGEAINVHGDDMMQELKRTLRKQDTVRNAPVVAATNAAKANLNPWRYLPGETGLQRQQRAGQENATRRQLGLPTYSTPISWDNANRKRSK